MTLVNITLTEDEQMTVLRFADEIANECGILTPWESIAGKIRRARDSSLFETRSPGTADGNQRLEAIRRLDPDGIYPAQYDVQKTQSPEHPGKDRHAGSDTR